jgi:hypothetical protein
VAEKAKLVLELVVFDFGVRIDEFASSSFGGIDEFDFPMSRRI